MQARATVWGSTVGMHPHSGSKASLELPSWRRDTAVSSHSQLPAAASSTLQSFSVRAKIPEGKATPGLRIFFDGYYCIYCFFNALYNFFMSFFFTFYFLR